METSQGEQVNDSNLRQHLASEPLPLSLVAADRRDHGYDTTYDHFLWDYVGHPYSDSYPEVRRYYAPTGERVYNKRLLSSYSEQGSLVHVRARMGRIDDANRAQDYFVVSADLNEQTVTEWRVAQVEYQGVGSDFRTTLVLSDKSLEVIAANPGLDSESDPLQDAIRYRKELASLAMNESLKPRIELTSQGCWFTPGVGASPESLRPINELATRLSQLYQKFGHLAVLHSYQPQKPATAIVAV